MATAIAAASRALPLPPAFPAAPAIRAGWALFDPLVLTGEVDADTAAACATSDGHDVRVSLRLADPPAASYVLMRTDAELYRYNAPSVVAADGGLLLIHATVEVLYDYDPPLSSQEHNFFVYEAHPVSPLLRLLPHGHDLGFTGIVARRCDGKEEEAEEEEFVAADFYINVNTGAEEGGAGWREGSESREPEEVGKLTRFLSTTGKCEVLELPIPFDPSKGLYKFTWRTDKVVSFGNLMCFVDYHRGILLCDVFAASPELRFLPLPEIEVWDDAHDYRNGRGLPEAYRTVDVSQGVMKFVDVSDGLFGRRRSPFGVCITMWTLRTAPELGCWEKDAVLRLDDLWSFHEFRRSPMPRWVPQLPAVCKHDPDVVQFALLDPELTPDNAWVIMVDMRQMELQGYAPYKNQAKERDDLEEDAGGCLFDHEALMCSEGLVVGCLFHDKPLISSDLCVTFGRMEAGSN